MASSSAGDARTRSNELGMGHDGPLLGSRPGPAANDERSGPIATRMVSVSSLPSNENLDTVPVATGWFLGGLQSRIYRSGF